MILVVLALAAEPAVLEPGQTYRATEKVFVLPEPMFDTCLAKAQALEDVEAELEKRGAELSSALRSSMIVLDACTAAGAAATQDKLLLQKDVVRLRSTRNLLIGGSVVLTAIVAAETYVLIETVR